MKQEKGFIGLQTRLDLLTGHHVRVGWKWRVLKFRVQARLLCKRRLVHHVSWCTSGKKHCDNQGVASSCLHGVAFPPWDLDVWRSPERNTSHGGAPTRASIRCTQSRSERRALRCARFTATPHDAAHTGSQVSSSCPPSRAKCICMTRLPTH